MWQNKENGEQFVEIGMKFESRLEGLEYQVGAFESCSSNLLDKVKFRRVFRIRVVDNPYLGQC